MSMSWIHEARIQKGSPGRRSGLGKKRMIQRGGIRLFFVVIKLFRLDLDGMFLESDDPVVIPYSCLRRFLWLSL
jgi:hypothetical protein